MSQYFFFTLTFVTYFFFYLMFMIFYLVGFLVPGLSPHLVESRLSHISSLLGLIELVLDLPVLGQGLVSDLLGLLSLPLVGLDLDLELVDQVLDPGEVLLVLIGLVGDLLDLPLEFPGGLDAIGGPPLLGIKLVLDLPEPGLDLLDLLLATLESDLLGLIKPGLKVLDGVLHVLLHPLEVRRLVLLLLELLRHHGGVGDGLLGLLLSVPALGHELLDLVLGLGKLGLELPLAVDQRSVLSVEQVRPLGRLVELGLSQFPGPLGLLDAVPELFDLAGQESGPPLDNSHLLSHIVAPPVSLVELGLGVLDLSLEGLHVLLGISRGPISMTKLDLKVVEVRLDLLLLPDSLSPRLGLGIEGSLHGLKSPLAVPPAVLELLFLLGHPPLDILLVLRGFDLKPEDLGLLGLDGAFSLFESSLELVPL